METTKLIEIAKLIIEKTNKGELIWERTGNENEFETASPNFGITLRKDRPSAEPELWFHNDKGEVFETFPFSAAIQADIYKEMRELYEKARRQALGVDKYLDDLLNELKKVEK